MVIKENDEEAGTIVAKRRGSLITSYGENVCLYLRCDAARSTQLNLISDSVVKSMVLDWGAQPSQLALGNCRSKTVNFKLR
ncbi:MAG: hypothetical protein HC821_01680 [Lewinella sp.]|nr:hypothetical protein [Lewinella sp.]